MGFRQPGDSNSIIAQLGALVSNANSPYNDGWTASSCKRQLYLVKCYLDSVYPTLPKFANEAEWEKERLIELLKRKS